MTGPVDDERHAQAGLIHEALVEEAEVAEEKAVVGRVNDDGIFRKVVVVEVVEDPADVVVHAGHAGEVILHVALVFPAG